MNAFAESIVRRHNGVPTLVVNGKPLHGMTATSVAFNDPEVVQAFVRGGTEIMMIWIEVAIHCWKEIGVYDWTYAEKKLELFEMHSGNTQWLIRIRLGLVAEWYRHQYPAEVHNPPPYSERKDISECNIVSTVWRNHVGEVVGAFVTWLKTTRWAPRIIGFMLNAGSSEEWLIFDTADTTRGKYHPATVREFRAWLKHRYEADLDRLRQSWNDPAVTFESASPPVGIIRKGSHIWGPYSLRDPQIEYQAIDYYRFLNLTLADGLIHMCRVAKEAAETPVVCGGFHSYLWWESGVYSYIQEYGHTLIQRLNSSPHVDFVSDIASYDNRYPGGPGGYLGLSHSLALNNKLHYTEVDLRTVSQLTIAQRAAWQQVDLAKVSLRSAEPALPDRIWKWSLGYCGRDDIEEVARLQREHLHNLVTGTPYWWFDIVGHDYQAPFIVTALKGMSDLGKKAVHWDRRSISEVAFVCSEDTPHYQAAMNGELLRFELESCHGLLLDLASRGWGTAGLPFDQYELHDLAHPDFPGEQYKLIIFVNCAYVSARAATGVRRWQNSGRTLLWTHAAAVLDDRKLSPSLGEDLVGMKLGWLNQRQHIEVQIQDAGHLLTRGGPSLNFATEGSVGPVFFADDPAATVLGRLPCGRPAFALRPHTNWNSVYLSMLNFGPALLRNLAQFAGAHVWCESNDVIYANRSLLCLHTAAAGEKVIHLPKPAKVTDLSNDHHFPDLVDVLELHSPAYRTHAWKTEYISE